MPTEIKPTPVIRGQDAVRLWAELEANSKKKASKAEIERIRGNAQELKNIFKSKTKQK